MPHQVLALFNKCVRKMNAYLKAVVEADTEARLLAPKEHLQKAAKAARRMVNADGLTLADDLAAGAAEATSAGGVLGRLAASGTTAPPATSSKKGKPSSAATAAATALVMADPELMRYAVKGGDEDWQRALAGGASATVSLKTKGKGGAAGSGGSKEEVAANVSAAAEHATGPSSSTVDRVLAEAADERAEALNKNKKKKRAKILGGGFNETKEKASAPSPSNKKKKDKSRDFKKPEGKYKNV
jgi:hypothetical protein